MKWPGNPRDVNPAFDSALERRETDYIEHEAGEDGMLEYDVNTLEILPVPWPHGPIKLPDKFLQVDQPYVSSCSRPSEGNRGCASWRGCPYRAYPGVGPFNIIIKRKKRTEAVPCYNYYYSKTSDGYRAATISYKSEGWDIDTSRTTVDSITSNTITNPDGSISRKYKKIEVPVRNLGPMYDKHSEVVGDYREGDQERPEVSRGSGDGRDRLLEDTDPRGRNGSKSGREGRGSTEARVRTVQVADAKQDTRQTEEVRSNEADRPTGKRGGNLRSRRGKVSKAGVGTEGD